MAAGAGVGESCTYRVADATQVSHGQGRFDAAICCFMLEHLEQPAEFLAGLAPALKPGALAFVTLALTAAQTDHIYEFRLESEAIVMAEKAGFELLECRVARPQRLMPKARFVPRVQALLLRRL
jgi:2-polyprenyl-3-methyl-5-hydroxy-6-metoxy-1,4-benzoquinol methylase